MEIPCTLLLLLLSLSLLFCINFSLHCSMILSTPNVFFSFYFYRLIVYFVTLMFCRGVVLLLLNELSEKFNFVPDTFSKCS